MTAHSVRFGYNYTLFTGGKKLRTFDIFVCVVDRVTVTRDIAPVILSNATGWQT